MGKEAYEVRISEQTSGMLERHRHKSDAEKALKEYSKCWNEAYIKVINNYFL